MRSEGDINAWSKSMSRHVRKETGVMACSTNITIWHPLGMRRVPLCTGIDSDMVWLRAGCAQLDILKHIDSVEHMWRVPGRAPQVLCMGA